MSNELSEKDKKKDEMLDDIAKKCAASILTIMKENELKSIHEMATCLIILFVNVIKGFGELTGQQDFLKLILKQIQEVEGYENE